MLGAIGRVMVSMFIEIRTKRNINSKVNGSPVSDKGMPDYVWLIIQNEIIDIPTHSLGLMNS